MKHQVLLGILYLILSLITKPINSMNPYQAQQPPFSIFFRPITYTPFHLNPYAQFPVQQYHQGGYYEIDKHPQVKEYKRQIAMLKSELLRVIRDYSFEVEEQRCDFGRKIRKYDQKLKELEGAIATLIRFAAQQNCEYRSQPREERNRRNSI